MTNPFDFFAVDLTVVVLFHGINKNEVNLDLFSQNFIVISVC